MNQNEPRYPDITVHLHEVGERHMITRTCPEPGSTIPPAQNGGLAGYIVGMCGHRVAYQEWLAGFRNCERCGEEGR